MAHDTPFHPPATFDGFAVERPLGRGGMGQVFLGRDVDLDRAVALKFIAAREGSTTALERFKREARAIARLSHQNVVNIYRIGEVQGHPYIAYELVAGKSLDRTAMPLPWQIVLRIAVGIARGLEAVHVAGILHRDLKPANVVLGSTGQVKLIDFGLASLVAGEVERNATGDEVPMPLRRTVDGRFLTRPGTVLGTPEFVAPEMWAGRPASTKSDVFALGMTLYEMLVGSLPHASLTIEEVSRFTITRDMPLLRKQRPDVPESFAAIVDRCLRRDADERFASGTELREILETTERVFLPAGASAEQALILDANHVAVASSFTRVKNSSGEFATAIYDRLFERTPAVRELFPADMRGQQQKLVHMIEIAIGALSNPELDGVLEDLGRRHVHYGARVEHFASLWAALLEALERYEGDAWTPELAAAWKHALTRLEDRMRRGMEGEKATVVSSAKNVLRVPPPIFGVRVSPPTPTGFRSPRTQYAHDGDIDIAYQTFGEGPVDVVLMMGWLSHLELNWGHAALMSFLEHLARFARVTTYDKRGTGLSARGQQSVSLDDQVSDLLLVAGAAGLQRPVLFGVGDAGTTAILAAALHPSRFAGLVLFGATPRLLASSDFPAGLTPAEFAVIESEIRSHWGEPVLVDKHAPSLASDASFRDWTSLYLRMSASPNDAWAMMRSNAARDVRAILPHVSLPALVMHRTGDRAVPLAAGRYLADHLPRATLAQLAGDDHVPWAGATDELMRLAQDFLTRLPKDEPAPNPVRMIAALRNVPSLDRVTTDLAARLEGSSLGDVGETRAFAFAKPRHAIVFLQLLAETVRTEGIDLACAIDAAVVAPGSEALAATGAVNLIALASPGRAPIGPVAASLLTGSNASIVGDGEMPALVLVQDVSAA